MFSVCSMAALFSGCGVKSAPTPVLKAPPSLLQQEASRRAAEAAEQDAKRRAAEAAQKEAQKKEKKASEQK